MAHLESRLFDTDDGDANSVVDETLCEYLTQSPWPGDYDIVGGLVGFGVYALERLPRPSTITCLKLVIDRLEETAERTAEGITWYPAGVAPGSSTQGIPNGHYNLGLAHGVPGVIALLGQICGNRDKRLREARQKVRPMLNGAVPWLLAQELARVQSFLWAVAKDVAQPSRSAWCYGDLGIAVGLLQAARGAREASWEEEALRIARRCAERPAEQCGVVDCGRHGAAGVGHLFNRLFQASGEKTFKDAARFWFACTLEMRQVDKAIAGLRARRPDLDRPGEVGWFADPGILGGAAGIGLALLAATTEIEPSWDRMMLISIPRGTPWLQPILCNPFRT